MLWDDGGGFAFLPNLAFFQRPADGFGGRETNAPSGRGRGLAGGFSLIVYCRIFGQPGRHRAIGGRQKDSKEPLAFRLFFGYWRIFGPTIRRKDYSLVFVAFGGLGV